jgi:hypothetical protein
MRVGGRSELGSIAKREIRTQCSLAYVNDVEPMRHMKSLAET